MEEKEKQMYRNFKQQADEITNEQTWTGLWKGNLKRETESLLIEAWNTTIKTHYIKGKIDNTQQNSKSRLCGEKWNG